MTAWWESLTLLQKIFTFLAVPATIILLLQSILLLFGIGGHADADLSDVSDLPDDIPDSDADGSGDGLALFTVRGIVAFFAVGGWTGVFLGGTALPSWLTVLLALAAGMAALVFLAWAMKASMKLQSAGNLQLKNAVGHTAVVYLPIGPDSRQAGKVSVTVQERLVEADAVSHCGRTLETGERVRVSGLLGEDTLLVEPLPVSVQEN